jgi:hypothetical protein
MTMIFRRSLLGAALLSTVLWSAPILPASAQTLYDAGLGTLPESQAWSYGVIAIISPVKLLTNNSVLLDTTAASSIHAGWTESPGPDLNRTNGFSMVFNVQLNSEAHGSTSRAGFSVIVLGDDLRGVELGFWTNTIFAQSDSPIFTHAEDASVVTAGAFVNYALSILATNYVLSANGASILSGPLRNYSAFGYPYNQTNFIFFGDDTGSANASFNVRVIALILPPRLAMSASGVVTWTGVSNQTYRVQSSTNLTSWRSAGTSTSPTSSFWFTNNPALPAQFFRVTFP